MMEYRITSKGKKVAREVRMERNKLLDFLYEAGNKGATFEECSSEVGRERVSTDLRKLRTLHLVEASDLGL